MKRFSIIQKDMSRCYFCGDKAVHKNEVYIGKNRNNSIKYGLVVGLCFNCHEGTYGYHGKYGKEKQDKLKIIGQIAFEEKYPELNFLSIFYKNYK